jgi:hypothetical protein
MQGVEIVMAEARRRIHGRTLVTAEMERKTDQDIRV